MMQKILKWALCVTLLLGVGVVVHDYLFERAKKNVHQRIATRINEIDPEEGIFWGIATDVEAKGLLERPGPKRVILAKSSREKTVEVELFDMVLEVEPPDRIEDKEGRTTLYYSKYKVTISRYWREESLVALPASWGAGPYDKLLTALNTTESDVADVGTFLDLWDLEKRVVEKANWGPTKWGTPREEVVGDGFIGLMTVSNWSAGILLRPEADSKPLWEVFVGLETSESRKHTGRRAPAVAMEFFESLTVRSR